MPNLIPSPSTTDERALMISTGAAAILLPTGMILIVMPISSLTPFKQTVVHVVAIVCLAIAFLFILNLLVAAFASLAGEHTVSYVRGYLIFFSRKGIQVLRADPEPQRPLHEQSQFEVFGPEINNLNSQVSEAASYSVPTVRMRINNRNGRANHN